MSVKVAVAVGELLDKITILEIKASRLTDRKRVGNVEKELAGLKLAWSDSSYARFDIADDLAALKRINERLWEIEDQIRDKEGVGSFDAEFVELARSVYVCNDERAAIKRRVNEQTGSELIEEKAYRDYAKGD
jgi:hypothetical protein